MYNTKCHTFLALLSILICGFLTTGIILLVSYHLEKNFIESLQETNCTIYNTQYANKHLAKQQSVYYLTANVTFENSIINNSNNNNTDPMILIITKTENFEKIKNKMNFYEKNPNQTCYYKNTKYFVNTPKSKKMNLNVGSAFTTVSMVMFVVLILVPFYYEYNAPKQFYTYSNASLLP